MAEANNDGGDAIYSEFLTEIGYQLVTSTKIVTEQNEQKEDKDDFEEMSTIGCVRFLIDLISEFQSSVFQWESVNLNLTNH